jgi:hypothetical protein
MLYRYRYRCWRACSIASWSDRAVQCSRRYWPTAFVVWAVTRAVQHESACAWVRVCLSVCLSVHLYIYLSISVPVSHTHTHAHTCIWTFTHAPRPPSLGESPRRQPMPKALLRFVFSGRRSRRPAPREPLQHRCLQPWARRRCAIAGVLRDALAVHKGTLGALASVGLRQGPLPLRVQMGACSHLRVSIPCVRACVVLAAV